MKNYRGLTEEEILQLKNQQCMADDWTTVEVAQEFTAEWMHGVRLSGEIRLGCFNKIILTEGGLTKHSGIRYATLHNVSVGNNCIIENIHNAIANCDIEADCYISNVDTILCNEKSSFGNGVEVAVLNETGGREVTVTDRLSSQTAYIMAMYRHRPELISRLKQMALDYADSIASVRGTIGSRVTIANCGTLKNLRIGSHATLRGVARLTNGSINSNAEAPTYIGQGVMCDDFIISSGSHVDDGTMLTRCFVGQACHIGHGYSASDSLFFSNCQEENGEACAIFAGPYTVTHHKSTLLIAGMFSFMNAGSNSNQSNHMYKLGPIHQGVLERGSKTASGSYILWPARVGAFSLVMGHHMSNSDTADLPFSYLMERDGDTYIVPGVNLRSAGTVRDAQKWPKRDKRTDSALLDSINFNLLSPYTVQKAMRGNELLCNLREEKPEADIYEYNGGKITPSALAKGIGFYKMTIEKYLGGAIVKRLLSGNFNNREELKSLLANDDTIGTGEWVDISGLLAPRSEVESLLNEIENGKVENIEALNSRIAEIHANYERYEWAWCYRRFTQAFGNEPDKMNIPGLIAVIEQWRKAVTDLDWMISEDARKEFSNKTMTGFGIDGDESAKRADFSSVRGNYESDSFVRAVEQHAAEKCAIAQQLTACLRSLK